jgi:hypothetical protein
LSKASTLVSPGSFSPIWIHGKTGLWSGFILQGASLLRVADEVDDFACLNLVLDETPMQK